MHIFKEAVVSNRIEGTRINIEEALNEQNNLDPEKRDDWQEVHNYVQAMNSAITELDTLPLSNRLIKNTHKVLLSIGKRAATGIDLLQILFSKPIVTGTIVQDTLHLSAKAANSLLHAFTEAAILKETTGYRRNRIFIFDEYVRLF